MLHELSIPPKLGRLHRNAREPRTRLWQDGHTQLLESQASLDDHQQPLFTNDVSAGTQSNDSTQLLQTQEVLNSQDNAESET